VFLASAGPALEPLVSVPPLILDTLSDAGYLAPAPPGEGKNDPLETIIITWNRKISII
jgi:hypothetical protein